MTLYQEIRAAARLMNKKVLAVNCDFPSELPRVAKRLTVPVLGRTIMMDDETTQNALLDFFCCEYRQEGKTFVERVDPVASQLSSLETECLEGIRCSRTSLFLTTGVRSERSQISLRDLLETERPEVLLTDQGWSSTLQRSQKASALFCRVKTIQGITMTSGFSFVFDVDLVPGLLQAHRQKLKKVPPENLSEERFIFFFKKHREIGSPQVYQDVS